MLKSICCCPCGPSACLFALQLKGHGAVGALQGVRVEGMAVQAGLWHTKGDLPGLVAYAADALLQCIPVARVELSVQSIEGPHHSL